MRSIATFAGLSARAVRTAAAGLLLGALAPAPALAQEFAERDAVREELAQELGLAFVTELDADTDIGLLAVDFQRSFTDPAAALYVEGAESDVAAVDAFVRENMGRVTHAWYTMDTHPRYYVGSKLYLVDASGEPAPMFVDIEPSAVLAGDYRAANPNHQENAEAYARCLEEKGLKWNVWPDHGEQGSLGWSLHPIVSALFDDYAAHWSTRVTRAPDPMIVYKGSNPHTEAFGGVEAICPGEDPHTHRQDLWLEEMRAHVEAGGVIIGFGEAINFCLSGTLIPLITDAGFPPERIILAYDASSPIPVFAQRTRAALREAQELGMRFTRVADLSVAGDWRETSTGQPLMNYALPSP